MNGKNGYRRSSFFAIVALTASLFATSAAFARGGACASDVQRLCGDAGSGRAAIASCLKKHASELSPSCKKHAAAMKKRTADFAQACRSDFSKFCKGTRPGGGRVIQCLRKHQKDLSPECQAQMHPGA